MLALRKVQMQMVTAGAQKFAARSASSLVTKYADSVKAAPLKEAVRYTYKNLKWTTKDFNRHSDSHANALLEMEFQPGETIAVWLPECAEKHVVMVTAAKCGLKVVEIDINITDVREIRTALKLANCKSIYMRPVVNEISYPNLLRQAIPELFDYDDSHGQLFRSKYFPSMRYFILCSPEFPELGFLNYDQIMLPGQNHIVQKASTASKDDVGFYQIVSKGANGVEISKEYSPKDAIEQPSWYFLQNFLNNKYFEVEDPSNY